VIAQIFPPQNTSQIFPATTGGAEQLATDMEIPFLGKLPLDPRIGMPHNARPYLTILYTMWIPYHTIPYHTIPYHTIPHVSYDRFFQNLAGTNKNS
jgi:hypothetical protein